MDTTRNAVLSTTYFIRQRLDASPTWSGMQIIGDVPDDNKVVTRAEATGDPEEVIIPATYIGESFSRTEGPVQLGGSTVKEGVAVAIYIYAESPGQEKDLRAYIKNYITDVDAPYYDFTNVGYPPQGAMTSSGYIEYFFVRSNPAYNKGNINMAIRYGGLIQAIAQFERNTIES